MLKCDICFTHHRQIIICAADHPDLVILAKKMSRRGDARKDYQQAMLPPTEFIDVSTKVTLIKFLSNLPNKLIMHD